MPRYLLPFVLVFIAIFTFGCVLGGFIGWISGVAPFTDKAGEIAGLTIFCSVLGAGVFTSILYQMATDTD